MQNDPFLQFLEINRHKTFYRKPFGGNCGDTLIQKGTKQILSDLDIRVTVDPRKADVILWPGGNLTMWYQNVAELAETMDNYQNAQFIVGPATFRFTGPDWVRTIVERQKQIIGLFARDPESYNNLLKAPFSEKICLGLSHDPALYLRNSNWLKKHREVATEEYVLAIFRSDHEGVYGSKLIFLIMKKVLPGRISRAICWMKMCHVKARRYSKIEKHLPKNMRLRRFEINGLDFETFVEVVRGAKEVHTDRLHVMLFAAMFGKPVFAYPTSHAKLEVVFNHSVKGWGNVVFVQDC